LERIIKKKKITINTNKESTLQEGGFFIMFELTNNEYNYLIINARSQFVTLGSEDSRGKFPKYAPFAFTEQGVAMLSSV
jgi:hypothetical protein